MLELSNLALIQSKESACLGIYDISHVNIFYVVLFVCLGLQFINNEIIIKQAEKWKVNFCYIDLKTTAIDVKYYFVMITSANTLSDFIKKSS